MLPVMLIGEGCSTISTKIHTVGHPPPLCKQGLENKKIAVYWGTAWRADQKETSTRERYVEAGIKKFFLSTRCVQAVSLSKRVLGRNALLATDAELISDGQLAGADYAVRLRVEELGPNVYLYLSPILWETKNEVLLQIQVLDTARQTVESDTSIHRTRGGPFTFHSAGSLPTDFANTLHAIFYDEAIIQINER